MRRTRERTQTPEGFIRLRMLLCLLILGGGVYLSVKFVPPYWGYLSMLDPVKEAAMAARTGKEEQVRADLILKARQVGVELAEENVEIVWNGDSVVVRVAWEVPVNLPRYPRVLRFRVESKNPAI
jgi:hypothetical protein